MIGATVEGKYPGINTNLTDTMKAASVLMLDSVRKNFGAGGRPETWAALKKGGQSFLFQSGRFMRGIHAESDATSAEVSTSDWVANKIHQFGGWAGRNHASYIPARPYMLFQDEDVVALREMVADGIFTEPQPIVSITSII